VIAVVDTNVVLRKLFGEPEPLAEWASIRSGYVSRVLLVELGRVIDRCRLAGEITDTDVAQLHQEARRLLRSFEILALSEGVLDRAAGPMPTVLGSLDAIHLVTALELARVMASSVTLATHDDQLARAARASGLDVCGA
jgi:predicted nucleic acid-binding protein